MNRIKGACGGSVVNAFEASGHPIKRTKVPISFFKELSQEQCNLLALTTYPLAKRRVVYIYTMVVLFTVSLVLMILALTQGYALFVIRSNATPLARLGDIFVATTVVLFIAAAFSFPSAENAIGGFYMVDGAKRLRFGGFVRFLYKLAHILTYVFGIIIVMIMAFLGGVSSSSENTVVIGLPYMCEPEDVPELYGRVF